MDNRTPPDTPWYRVPLLWVGIAVLLVSLAGSIHLIVVSQKYQSADTSEEDESFRGVPLTRKGKDATESKP